MQPRYWIIRPVSPCNLDLRTSHRSIKAPVHVINTLLTQYPIQQHPPALISPRNFPLNQQKSLHTYISHPSTGIYNQYTNSQLQPTATSTSTNSNSNINSNLNININRSNNFNSSNILYLSSIVT